MNSDSSMSGISALSLASSCDHARVARNGTTFSGNKMKYVFHYSRHAGLTGDDYLTPTQRAQKQVRNLKSLLQQAHKDLGQKDNVIFELTEEVIELRRYKASLCSPDERFITSDAVILPENQMDDDLAISLNVNSEMTGSSADSRLGHGTDSKDSEMFTENFAHSSYKDRRTETDERCVSTDDILYKELVADYERKIRDLVKSHEIDTMDLRVKHMENESLLMKRIFNSTKQHLNIVRQLNNAKERIRKFEFQLEDVLRKLKNQDEKNKQIYEEVKKVAEVECHHLVLNFARQVPLHIFVSKLMEQHQVTRNELEKIKVMYNELLEAKNKEVDREITLQFLKSTVYYFLTDRANNQDHLRAIQSILGFSPKEVQNIKNALPYIVI